MRIDVKISRTFDINFQKLRVRSVCVVVERGNSLSASPTEFPPLSSCAVIPYGGLVTTYIGFDVMARNVLRIVKVLRGLAVSKGCIPVET